MKNNQEQLITALESVALFVKDIHESINFDDVPKFEKDAFKVIHEKLELNRAETVLFSVLFYLQIEDSCVRKSASEVARFLQITPFELYRQKRTIESLQKRLFIELYPGGSGYDIAVNKSLLKRIIRLQTPKIEKKQFNVIELSASVYHIIEANKGRYGQDLEDLVFSIQNLYDDYANLEELKQMDREKFTFTEKTIFLYTAFQTLNYNRSADIDNVIESISLSVYNTMKIRKDLINKKSVLIKNAYIVQRRDNFLGDSRYILDKNGKKLIGLEAKSKVKSKFVSDIGNVLTPKSLDAIELYFNPKEGKEIKRLEGLLVDKEYKRCRKVLKSKSMPLGLTSMFFGPPGTGKTELVYQLAKSTDRKILLVDVSKIKDSFVGESEKRVAKIFEEYKTFKKGEKLTPILFLNEADALLTKRGNAESSVDKMYNSMQNIFLQKIEDFDGILIATSNLLQNLDTAFERRFLFKLRINRPNQENRLRIIKKHFKGFKKSLLTELSKDFDLSGAQIVNVHRKLVMDEVMGHKASDSRLVELFEQEQSMRKQNVKRIGF